ncbi:hypothetical protein DFH09DRAFT_1325567 [Mycena vulgaris]|nr:hypothetical protein DFH09DRAFT_1325567 [Mycena vulgaris]
MPSYPMLPPPASDVRPARAPDRAAASGSGSSSSPIVVAADHDKYAARGLIYQTVHPDHVDWIVPPKVHPSPSKKGKWEKWELDFWAAVQSWVSRGQRKDVDGDEWYDWENKRRLFLGDFVIPEGVTDPDRFGVPVPRFPFIYDDGRDSIPKRASSWMYKTMEPRPIDSGREAPVPEPSHLPRRRYYQVKVEEAEEELHRFLSPEAEEGGSRDKGKGKAKASEEEDDEDEHGGGMDVDEPAASDRPSNVVVAHGIDSSVSAIMFRHLATDTFLQARAAPLAIVNGQGRMWIRFETASEGLRALSVRARIGCTEDASFSSDSEFHEAATYSRDLWSLETEDVEMTPPLPEKTPPVSPLVSAVVPRSPSPPAGPLVSASEVPPPAPIATATPPAPVATAMSSGPSQAPQAPRAMLRSTESFLAKLSLEKQLTDPPLAPLADRLSDPPFSPLPPLTSLAQRMVCSAPPLASRISEPEEPPPKRQKMAAGQTPTTSSSTSSSPSPAASPSKCKQCGVCAGRLVKEQRAAREKRREEAEALAAQPEAAGDSSLLSWIPTLAVVAEEEAREMEEIDGTAGWSHEGDDDDDIAPIAGPSRLH